MLGNMHDGKYMSETFGQVHSDLTEGSTMIFDVGANNKTDLNTIVEDGKYYVLLDEVGHRDQTYPYMNGRCYRQFTPDRFSRPGHDLRDTFPFKPATSVATKFITDAMQKLTLTVINRKDGGRRLVLSNFTSLNVAVLRCYGLFSEMPTM